jgi:hypothetical protein
LPKLPRVAQSITSSGTSQASAAAKAGEFARVTASGGPIYAAAVATVTSANGWAITDGLIEVFGPLAEGDVVSIIDLA